MVHWSESVWWQRLALAFLRLSMMLMDGERLQAGNGLWWLRCKCGMHQGILMVLALLLLLQCFIFLGAIPSARPLQP